MTYFPAIDPKKWNHPSMDGDHQNCQPKQTFPFHELILSLSQAFVTTIETKTFIFQNRKKKGRTCI
jgi:hypothetical protein